MNAITPDSPWIQDTTDASFAQDVTERSRHLPIVVDFWADWCQPCRALGPVLERLAIEFEGRFVLIKANTERNAVAAAQYQVQTIPSVYGLRQGRIVDGFLGAMPEPEIRRWLERFLPSPAALQVEAAQSLAESDPAQAENRLRQALALDSRCDAARIELARLLLRHKRMDECRAILSELENRGFLEPDAARIKSALEIDELGRKAGDLSTLADRRDSHPEDHENRLQFAIAHAAAGHFEEALRASLDLVRTDRGPVRQRARELMLDIFRVLPDDSELVPHFRRQLALALY